MWHKFSIFSKLITKGDLIILIFLILLTLASFSICFFLPKSGEWVIIEIHNKPQARLRLKENQYYTITGVKGKTEIEIKNQCVRIIDSCCPHKICVHTGWISRPGQIIACVPNKVLIYISGSADDELDAITY